MGATWYYPVAVQKKVTFMTLANSCDKQLSATYKEKD